MSPNGEASEDLGGADILTNVSEPTSTLALGQINIVVRDMQRSLAFYSLLGLSVEEIQITEWAPHHASAVTSNGVRVDFDSVAFAKQWNSGLDETKLAKPQEVVRTLAGRTEAAKRGEGPYNPC